MYKQIIHLYDIIYHCRDKYKSKRKTIDQIVSNFNGDLRIPLNFTQTAPPHSNVREKTKHPPKPVINPQTKQFCSKLHITNPNEVFLLESRDSDESDMSDSDGGLTAAGRGRGSGREKTASTKDQDDDFEIVFE